MPPLKGEVPRVSVAEGFPAVRRIPIGMHRGEFVPAPCCPLWGWCSAQRIKITMIAGGNHTSVSCRSSGKGGVVSNFEMLPFNEQHPLSQPVRAASSPLGEPRGPLRIRPGFHKAVSACRETPLRLAKSRLTAVARLHGACGRTSQARWACQLSFALSSCTPPFGRLHLLNLSGALWAGAIQQRGYGVTLAQASAAVNSTPALL